MMLVLSEKGSWPRVRSSHITIPNAYESLFSLYTDRVITSGANHLHPQQNAPTYVEHEPFQMGRQEKGTCLTAPILPRVLAYVSLGIIRASPKSANRTRQSRPTSMLRNAKSLLNR